MTYVPGGPRPAGPLPEVATARQAEVARQLAGQHDAREARQTAKEQAPRRWWRRFFGRAKKDEGTAS